MKMKQQRPQLTGSQRKSKKRLGAAVVEFALVSPLMILLTLGMMELGRAVMVKQLLLNASREGARKAVLPGAENSSVAAQVVADLAATAITGVTVDINPGNLSSTAAGTPVTVSVSIPASQISWIPNPIFTVSTVLESSTTMRKESQ